MARIAGVNLPVNKRALVSLTYIHGIGPKFAMDILKANSLDPTKRIKDFSEDEISKIRKSIDENYTVEGDLRRDVSQNIKRLKDLGCQTEFMKVAGFLPQEKGVDNWSKLVQVK